VKKMPCLFVREFIDKRTTKLLPQVTPGCEWVFTEPDVKATRKWDGTAVLVANGKVFKRYDAKRLPDGTFKMPPEGGRPCTEGPDEVTGHWPHWVAVDLENPKSEEKWIAAAATALEADDLTDGTYEACGPKIGGNPQGFDVHLLVRHGEEWVSLGTAGVDLTDAEKHAHVGMIVANHPSWEGIVFHRANGDMCKIRRKDYGLVWPPAREAA
jgi:hypothetical protein